MENIINDLKICQDNIFYNEPMKKHTSFKIGGKADCFIKVKNVEELKRIVKYANEKDIPLTIIGNGSNLLVLDGGIRGIVLKIEIDGLNIKEENESIKVKVGSGYKLGQLAQIMLKNEISGLEELSGIPGTIGGAIKMNAGAHGKEIKDVVENVTCMDYNGNIIKFQNKDMEFQYRQSILKHSKYIVLDVEFKLEKGNKTEIKNKMTEYAIYRKEKQPIEFPSAGSTFKRGNDFITAKLIDDAGLKGYTVGDAMVSTKHSGFVINKGNATAKDVLNLVKHVEEEIEKKFNKKIELEIEVLGESL